jgi:hypothetical protein
MFITGSKAVARELAVRSSWQRAIGGGDRDIGLLLAINPVASGD